MSIESLGYLRLSSPQVDRWHTLATEVVGLMHDHGRFGQGDHRYRLDDHPGRLVVEPADTAGLDAIGFQVQGRAALESLAACVERAGIAVEALGEDETAARGVLAAVRFRDPGGAPVELYCGPILDHVPCATPLVSAFVTGGQGLGHVVISTPDVDASVEFYAGVLGFEERNRMPLPGSGMSFLSPNARHHSIGVLQMPGPASLLHLMVQMATLDDVGRALDRVAKQDMALMFTLGRHTNDHMVSFYVYTPDGSAIEVGWGGLEVAMPSSLTVITRPSIWGHHYAPFPTAG
jgi:3,4-dihydroxy-9,10-secoandrosta-1,3,5(10)-triene-9,17-dione 4,5-dioxygenase